MRILSRRAFTFLEVLLALVILGVIGGSLYNTFATSIRLSRQADVITQLYRDGAGTLFQMAEELESAVPYDFSASYPEKSMFEGDAHSMSFIVPTGKGLAAVRYGLDKPDIEKIHTVRIGQRYSKNVSQVINEIQRGEYFDFTYSSVPLGQSLAGGGQATAGGNEILIPGVAEENVRFFYAYNKSKEAEPELEWKDKWTQGTVPAGVRIVLTLPDPQNEEGRPVTFERLVFIPTGEWGTDDAQE